MARVKSTDQLRKTFAIQKRMVTHTTPAYDVICLEDNCQWIHRGWDYRRNALNVGFNHAITHDDARVAALTGGV